MTHECLLYMQGEAAACELEARRIDQALQGEDAPEDVARRALARASDHLGPMFNEEEATIGAVIREHIADPKDSPWGREQAARASLEDAQEAMAADLAAGRDCREDLRRYAAGLRRYAAVERAARPWAEKRLGESLMREADARLHEYGRPEPEWPNLSNFAS